MYGLDDELLRQITQVARRFEASGLTLFGSRARGDFRPASDIDLAVYGLRERDELPMKEALDALPTLLKFDLVPVRRGLDDLLLQQIDKDGVVLMDHHFDKLEQLRHALERTREALAEYDRTQSAVVRDGAIQRFEFSAELAWKACRDRLLADGYVSVDSPKAVMRQALEAGLIADGQAWLNLLQARNLTSHVYNEQQARTIYEAIAQSYLPLMEKLAQTLGDE